MGGLALALLNFGIAHSTPGQPTLRLAADRPLRRQLGNRRSAIGVVRAGRIWYAVKLRGSPQRKWRGDLRYDFGLLAAKVQRHRKWTDVVPLRPRTISAAREEQRQH